MKFVVVAAAFLQFTGPTGARIDLNAEAIGSIRDPAAMPKGHFASGTMCVIVMRNGEAVQVQQTCDQTRQMVRGLVGPCTLVCGDTLKR